MVSLESRNLSAHQKVGGFCLQRRAWIHFLMAPGLHTDQDWFNDFMEEKQTHGSETDKGHNQVISPKSANKVQGEPVKTKKEKWRGKPVKHRNQSTLQRGGVPSRALNRPGMSHSSAQGSPQEENLIGAQRKAFVLPPSCLSPRFHPSSLSYAGILVLLVSWWWRPAAAKQQHTLMLLNSLNWPREEKVHLKPD